MTPRLVLHSLIVFGLSGLISSTSLGAPNSPVGSKPNSKPDLKQDASQMRPAKLPAKKKITKRTVINFAESDGVVIAPSASPQSATKRSVKIQSRSIAPAPPGDLAELPGSPLPLPSPTPVPPPVAKVALPPIPIEPMTEFSSDKPTAVATENSNEMPIQNDSISSAAEKMNTTTAVNAEIPTAEADLPEQRTEVLSARDSIAEQTGRKHTEPEPTASASATLAFLRTGYLQANYKKFDDRMKDGATFVGLGVAREFQTTWGSFEARASMDAYHAMDQSVTVDNIRMLATRTEVGYWFTKTRVRPGISLGLGWTDYSVRSYRTVSDQNNVTLKTHAKSQAFTVIPGTSLRIEIADGLVIDTQTEFLAILGGDSADAVQGLSFGASLGWLF